LQAVGVNDVLAVAIFAEFKRVAPLATPTNVDMPSGHLGPLQQGRIGVVIGEGRIAQVFNPVAARAFKVDPALVVHMRLNRLTKFAD
jgi:hypothetical protein